MKSLCRQGETALLTPCVCLSVWPSEQVIGDVGYAARETLNYLHRVCVLVHVAFQPTTVYSKPRLAPTTSHQTTVCTNSRLHQTTVCTNHRLHQTTVAPTTSHQTTVCTNHRLHQTTVCTSHGLHQPRFTPTTVYTKPTAALLLLIPGSESTSLRAGGFDSEAVSKVIYNYCLLTFTGNRTDPSYILNTQHIVAHLCQCGVTNEMLL